MAFKRYVLSWIFLVGFIEHFFYQSEYKKIGSASVTSAVPLSAEEKKQVEKRLLETTQYKSFLMEYQVDQELIGGMVIKIGDRVVDSSIRTKLNNMARELSKIQIAT